MTTGDATDNTIAITTGSAATSITDNFSSDTVTVNATALAQNTALTLAGSAAETVTGLVGDIAAGSLTGALTVTTGNAADNGINDHHRVGGNLDQREWRKRHVTVDTHGAGQNTALTLSGSAAETVTGLVGNINAEFADRGADRDHGRCDRQHASRSPPARRRPRSPITSAAIP